MKCVPPFTKTLCISGISAIEPASRWWSVRKMRTFGRLAEVAAALPAIDPESATAKARAAPKNQPARGFWRQAHISSSCASQHGREPSLCLRDIAANAHAENYAALGRLDLAGR